MSVADIETNATVFGEAEARHILCNAVDDMPHCNCYASAVVRRDPLQIAISTAGKSPALAQRLRKEPEERYGDQRGDLLSKLSEPSGNTLEASLHCMLCTQSDRKSRDAPNVSPTIRMHGAGMRGAHSSEASVV